MKNFYELLDTNPTIELILELEVINHNGDPVIEVILNNERIYGKYPLTSFRRIYTRLGLLESVKLEILMNNKQYNSKQETAIIIKNFFIDNINIIPTYNHLIDYQNDHNINTKTNYLGYNGTWTLNIDRPFYQWLHQASGQGWLLEP
jgi:hypothetical protein